MTPALLATIARCALLRDGRRCGLTPRASWACAPMCAGCGTDVAGALCPAVRWERCGADWRDLRRVYVNPSRCAS